MPAAYSVRRTGSVFHASRCGPRRSGPRRSRPGPTPSWRPTTPQLVSGPPSRRRRGIATDGRRTHMAEAMRPSASRARWRDSSGGRRSMCGIAGVFAQDPRADVTGIATRLSAAIAHRGPDAEGSHAVRGRSVILAHRRLSIVDVACGIQPMSNEDGRVRVSYNGEIYNHADVRRELEALGHTFRTRADTEVLVHGWEEWGPQLVERLNGIFAFAILDTRKGEERAELWLARDPVGVKPLYVGKTDGTWWFTSELAAARSAGLLDQQLRPDAFSEFLVY